MLIYHPVYDVNHSVYRALLVLENTQHDHIDLDLYRHIDFYFLFPHLIKEIKPFPSELKSFKKIINKINEPYEAMRNVHRIMYDLEAIQTTAIQNLMAKNLIDIESYAGRKLKRTEIDLPNTIYERVTNDEILNKEWFRMLINELPAIAFKGKKGLKARSGLMEFRYDVEPL